MEDDLKKRADVIAAQLRDEHTFESAIDALALHMVLCEDFASLLNNMTDAASILCEKTRSAWMTSSAKARKAASVRHEKPGGSNEKRNAIRAIWASGKYKVRSICAEQECAALDMSFDTARKALRNMPNPP